MSQGPSWSKLAVLAVMTMLISYSLLLQLLTIDMPATVLPSRLSCGPAEGMMSAHV